MWFKLSSRRLGGRTKRFIDVVKEDMRLFVVSKKNAEDGVRWRQALGCGLL